SGHRPRSCHAHMTIHADQDGVKLLQPGSPAARSGAGRLTAMSWDLEHLGRHPNPLSAHYREARVAERLLLTGHSHQAWPDVGRAAQDQAWRDAVTLLDGKWEAAATRAAAVGEGFR